MSTDQARGTLVKVLFEPNAKLSDSVTYDITAWSLPYAYGLDALASTSLISGVTVTTTIGKTMGIDKNAYAHIADWNSMKDARFLAELLQQKIRVRYALKPFTQEGKDYQRGSLIITKGDNNNTKDFIKILEAASKKHNKALVATKSGFVEDGKDFGSSYVRMIPDVKVAVLSGEPTSTLQFGEIWHFFEQQLYYPATILDSEYIDNVDLSEYDILVLPNGWGYGKFMNETRFKAIKEWVQNGGKLIAMGGAIDGISGENKFGLKARKMEKDTTINIAPFDETERDRIKEAITGAIFRTKVDITHPLAFGYDDDTYFTLKLGAEAYDYLPNGTVVYLEDGATRPVSGFAGSEAQKKIGETLVFGVEQLGRGSVVYMVDNPLFRGFWENGKLFFVNALFMVN